MIPDGYNRLHQLHGHSFVYRPLPAHMRSGLKSLSADLPEHLFQLATHQIVDRQMVVCDWIGGSESLPPHIFLELFEIVTAPTNHEANLYCAAKLSIRYPHLERAACRSCMAWSWNPLTGELHRDNAGMPQRRQRASVLLCQTPAGCPKGTPQRPIEFTPENRQAFEHYQMTGGAGSPEDELVAANWSIIKRAEDDARTERLSANPQAHGRTVGGSHSAHNHRHVRLRTAGAGSTG